MATIDPYKRSIEVLDTDYDDFMVFFTCYDQTE